MKKYLPLAANLISQTLLGMAYLFIRMGMAVLDQDALKFSALRFVMAAVMLTIIVLLPVGPSVRRPKGMLGLLALICLFNPLTSQLAKTASTTYVATSMISLFNSTIPAVMLGFSALINHEYPTRRQSAFVFVTMAGMLLAAVSEWAGEGLTPLGLFLVLAYVITISLSRVLVRRASGSCTAFELTYFQTATGAVGFALLSLGSHALSGGTLLYYFAGLASPQLGIALLYCSAGTCIGAFLLQNYASAHLPFAVYSASCTWSTVVGILSGVFLLQETFGGLQVLGTLIIFCGILGISFSYEAGDHRYPAKH